MKDLESGLTVASIEHLPLNLQEILRTGQPDGAVPQVFFAEMCFKLSEGRKNPLSKDRLLTITRDSVIIYSLDGFAKRIVSLVDIESVLIARNSQSSERQEKNSSRRLDVVSFALKIPGNYDVAMELAAGKRSDMIITSLAKTIAILRRQLAARLHKEKAGDVQMEHQELAVRMYCSALSALPFHSFVSLKKPRDRDAPPIVPPRIDVVTEDMQRRKAADHRLQLEEILSDLEAELFKYQQECWDARNTIYSEVSDQHTESLQRNEFLRLQRLATSRKSSRIAEWNDGRSGTIQKAYDSAQRQYTEENTLIHLLQDKHAAALAKAKHSIEAAEQKTQTHQNTLKQLRQDILARRRELDDRIGDLTDEAHSKSRELDSLGLLPSVDDLEGEISALQESTLRAEEAILAIEEDREQEEVLKALRRDLAKENELLEQEVLQLKEQRRDLADVTKQLVAEASTNFARRNRILEACRVLEREIAAARSETAALVVDAERISERESSLSERRARLSAERTVCEDLDRETLIHNSVTTSLVKAMASSENQAIDTENKLAARLCSYRLLRESVVSGRSPSGSIVPDGRSTPRIGSPL